MVWATVCVGFGDGLRMGVGAYGHRGQWSRRRWHARDDKGQQAAVVSTVSHSQRPKISFPNTKKCQPQHTGPHARRTWWFYGGCMTVVWRLYGGCTAVVWRLYGGCMAVVWRLYGGCMVVV